MKHIFRFQHKYVPIKATQCYSTYENTLTGRTKENVQATNILLRCECRNFKTKLIAGFWTLEDIQNKTKT